LTQYDWTTPDPRFVESIAHTRALEEARRNFGFPATLPESATLSAAFAEIFAGGRPYPVLPGEAGVVDVLRSYGDVRRYGAIGNGVHDDSPAFQSAVDFNSTVWVPEPTVAYLIPTPVTSLTKVRLIGIGDCPRIRGQGLTAAEYIFDIGIANEIPVNGIEDVEITNLAFEHDGVGPYVHSCIRLRNVANSKFRNLKFKECKYGMYVTGTRTFTNEYTNLVAGSNVSDNTVRFDNCHGGGHEFYGGTLSGGVDGCRVTGSTGSMSSVNFYGTNFEGCGNSSFYCDVHDIVSVGFFGTRSEGVLSEWDFVFIPPSGGYANGIAFAGCYFSGKDDSPSPDAEHAIVFSGVNGGTVTGASVQGCTAEDYTVSFIRPESDGGEGSIVCGNTLRRVPAVVSTVQAGMMVFNNIDDAGNFTGNQKWNPPLATPVLNAAATDLPTAVALLNQVRTLLRNNGQAT
jgi:hypothetical protein